MTAEAMRAPSSSPGGAGGAFTQPWSGPSCSGRRGGRARAVTRSTAARTRRRWRWPRPGPGAGRHPGRHARALRPPGKQPPCTGRSSPRGSAGGRRAGAIRNPLAARRRRSAARGRASTWRSGSVGAEAARQNAIFLHDPRERRPSVRGPEAGDHARRPDRGRRRRRPAGSRARPRGTTCTGSGPGSMPSGSAAHTARPTIRRSRSGGRVSPGVPPPRVIFLDRRAISPVEAYAWCGRPGTPRPGDRDRPGCHGPERWRCWSRTGSRSLRRPSRCRRRCGTCGRGVELRSWSKAGAGWPARCSPTAWWTGSTGSRPGLARRGGVPAIRGLRPPAARRCRRAGPWSSARARSSDTLLVVDRD